MTINPILDLGKLADTAARHVAALCDVTPDRRPGSLGNRQATDYVKTILSQHGWAPTTQPFDCVDWTSEGGHLTVAGETIEIEPSPYGHPVDTGGTLRLAGSLEELSERDLTDSILVLTGRLATEQLTPRAYPFYGNEVHARILDAIEGAKPAAVIAVTDLDVGQCGAVRPFPLIEDGEFPIPTANVLPEHAPNIGERDGDAATVVIRSSRRPAVAENVIGTRGAQDHRVLVVAHVDSKPNTPGAVDNASGVAVLLLVAELLADASAVPPIGVELLAVNGEDHYAAPGEVRWLSQHENRLTDIELMINVDGAGYRSGVASYSTYNVQPDIDDHITAAFARASLPQGPQWYQSDHAIFAMAERPAMAVTSEPIAEIMASVFHSTADTPDQVDPTQLAATAVAIADVITSWPT